ncbi:MAG TPA: protein phosphatase CheZ [Stellaceae bacterium]|jgi:chemotaxis regulatin CheY-phosphate phosphatase CheZ|nr:protein phosphatase CheZ [Stellaceae bacterium]
MSMTPPVLSDTEYLSIEEAISATAKGRAFLRQRDKIGRVIGVDAMGQMIRGLKDWIAGEESAPDRDSLELIRRELSAVRSHIDHVKSEISTLTEQESSDNRFRRATAELYEIVTSTARATDDILSAAEAIKEISDKLPPEYAAQREAFSKHCLNVFQACSFQDITGQRIAKVVKTLDYVEQRVSAMLAIGGDATDRPAEQPIMAALAAATTAPSGAVSGAVTSQREAETLLNGPQLPGKGLDQDAIDQLLTPAAAIAPVAVPATPANDEPMGQSDIDSMFG